MKDKVQAALNNYVLAYENNDKELFKSLWDDKAIFEDPVGADPCIAVSYTHLTLPTILLV